MSLSGFRHDTVTPRSKFLTHFLNCLNSPSKHNLNSHCRQEFDSGRVAKWNNVLECFRRSISTSTTVLCTEQSFSVKINWLFCMNNKDEIAWDAGYKSCWMQEGSGLSFLPCVKTLYPGRWSGLGTCTMSNIIILTMTTSIGKRNKHGWREAGESTEFLIYSLVYPVKNNGENLESDDSYSQKSSHKLASLSKEMALHWIRRVLDSLIWSKTLKAIC